MINERAAFKRPTLCNRNYFLLLFFINPRQRELPLRSISSEKRNFLARSSPPPPNVQLSSSRLSRRDGEIQISTAPRPTGRRRLFGNFRGPHPHRPGASAGSIGRAHRHYLPGRYSNVCAKSLPRHGDNGITRKPFGRLVRENTDRRGTA